MNTDLIAVKRKRFFSSALILVSFAFIFIMFTGTAQAITWTVCSSGCNFNTISSAIGSSSVNNGDTIQVQSGTYNEQVTVSKQLAITGVDTGGGMPVVTYSPFSSSYIIQLSANGIRLQGLKVQNSGTISYEYFISITSSNDIVQNNTLTSSTSGEIFIRLSTAVSNITISNNTLTGPGNSGDGVYFTSNAISQVTIKNNTISGMTTGIYYSPASGNGNLITGNMISGDYFYDIYLHSGNGCTISNNSISVTNSEFGIYAGIPGNTITGNTLSKGTYYSIYITTGGNIVTSNTLSGTYSMYVSASGNSIYNNYFNTTNPVRVSGTPINTWNTTMTSGTNIIGGSYLGGNYWANPSGTGWSQTQSLCNPGANGFCTSSNAIASNNIDYLPLTTLSISKTVTTTTIYSSSIPSVYGQSVTFTANITSSGGYIPDDETVTFEDNSTIIGTGTTSSGNATFNTSFLSTGNHSISAVYAGDTNFAGSTGSMTQQVNRGVPIIFWSNPADIVYSTPLSSTQLNATASVAGSFVYTPPSGTVLDVGTWILRTDFAPGDRANYTNASANVTIRVVPSPPGGSPTIPSGYGKFTSAPFDAGTKVTFASIQLIGTGNINQAEVYTAYSLNNKTWFNWTQTNRTTTENLYAVALGEYGRYFQYIIIAPSRTNVTGVTISYVESPDGVIYID